MEEKQSESLCESELRRHLVKKVFPMSSGQNKFTGVPPRKIGPSRKMESYLTMIGKDPLRLVFLVWCLVGLPIMAFDVTLPFPGWGDFIFLLVGAALVTRSYARIMGWQRTGQALGLTALITGSLEALGTKTGWIFGSYLYPHGNFGPLLADVLPLAIPLAWWCVLGGAWAVLGLWQRKNGNLPLLSTLVLASLIAVWVDFGLEPVAFHIRQYWLWDIAAGGFYYGVPLFNFISWAGVSLLTLALLVRWDLLPQPTPKPHVPGDAILVLAGILVTYTVANSAHGFFLAAFFPASLLAFIFLLLKSRR